MQMRSFELFGTLGPKQLHQEENQVGDVAFDKLVYKAGPLDLVQDRVDLVGLLTHVFEHVVNFTGVEHLLPISVTFRLTSKACLVKKFRSGSIR